MISPPSPNESEAAFMARCAREGGDEVTCQTLWQDNQGIAPTKSRSAMNARTPIPLRPDINALREAALTSLVRACVNAARKVHDRFAKSAWPDDRHADLIIRAATTPATLADTTALHQIALYFVASLIPVSAAAAVIARSLQLSFDRAAQISVPALTLPHAAWLGEGAPLPVVQGTSSPGALIDPYKLGVIVPLTDTMIRYSNAEAIVRQVLLENSAQSLDAALFSADAAVAGVKPAGILNGIDALPASAATSALDAMVADIGSIAAALAPSSGASQPMLIAAPRQAVSLAMLAPRDMWPPVLMSAALPDKTVIGVVPAALATVIDPPRIEAGSDPLVQMDDAPSGGVMTGPTISLYQSDQIGLKFIMPATWGLRSPSAVAWITGTAW